MGNEPQSPIDAMDEGALEGTDKIPTWRVVLLTTSVCVGLFLSLLDTTIVATAMYTIGVDLSSLESVNWVALAYTLSYLSCVVIFARVADIAGRRNSYAGAFAIFLASSLGCGFARTLGQLVVCRALQGVGGSGLYAQAFVILWEVVPAESSQWIAGLTGAIIAMAGVLGPILGGIITHYTTWRWVFWISALIGILPLVFFIVAWPTPSQSKKQSAPSWKELDFVGCVLIIGASVLVLFALQQAGLSENSWGTAMFIAPVVVGCACWALLFAWEFVVARFWDGRLVTMFPLRLLRSRVFVGNVLSILLAGFPYFLIIYSLPLRLEVVNAQSPLMVGVSLLPILASIAVASTASGMVNKTSHRICATLVLGSVLMVIATALLSTLANTTRVAPKMYGFEVVFGLGFGLVGSTVSLGAAFECEPKDKSVAQGIIAQARVLGGSIGIACSTAVLGVTQRRELAGAVTGAQLATLQVSAGHMTEAQLHSVRQAYSDAFAEEMRVCAVVSGVCVLAALATFRRSGPGDAVP